MACFYFDVHGTTLNKDERGEHLASLEDAKQHAHQVARTLATQIFTNRSKSMEVIVRDSFGEVFRVKVSTVN